MDRMTLREVFDEARRQVADGPAWLRGIYARNDRMLKRLARGRMMSDSDSSHNHPSVLAWRNRGLNLNHIGKYGAVRPTDSVAEVVWVGDNLRDMPGNLGAGAVACFYIRPGAFFPEGGLDDGV